MALKLLQYQIDGAAILAAKARYGLHDEPGVGKTATTIATLDRLNMKRGIIVCPGILRDNWRAEFVKFSTVERRVCKGTTIHDFVAWMRGRFDVLITSYEMASKWASRIAEMGEILDFLVIDEAHYLKNTNSKRSTAIIGPDSDGINGIAMWCVKVYHVTGTPITGDVLDLYSFLKLMQVINIGKHEFIKRYFHVRIGVNGNKHKIKTEKLAELQQLIDSCSLRRYKKDVGIHLPPVFITSIELDGDTSHIRNLLAQHPGLDKAIINAIKQGGLSFLDSQHIATLRRLVGEAKAVPFVDILLDELAAGLDKVVVMGLHKDALNYIHARVSNRGYGSVIVNGNTSETARQDAIKSFQQDPLCRVFVGNIQTAGVGLTLTAACELIMFESDWLPSGNAQAIMRVDRIGQTRNVRARFITLANSIDVMVNTVVAEKTAEIVRVQGRALLATP
jgi:SWI/SNF-related matrix-associated actin-dependent regulator of chromatin subfamily A-like protein 1